MFGDYVCTSALLILIFGTVAYNVRDPRFRKHALLIWTVVAIWTAFTILRSQILYGLLKMSAADEAGHLKLAREAADALWSGNPGKLWGLFKLGNNGFRFYLALAISATDSYGLSTRLFHEFLALCGSLSVVRALHDGEQEVSPLWIILVMFPPSLLFWSGSNLKEGLMYWAICQIFAGGIASVHTRSRWNMVRLLVGCVIGALFRPHVVIVWLMALAFSQLWEKRLRRRAVFALAGLGIAFVALQSRIAFAPSLESVGGILDMKSEAISRQGGSTIAIGTRIPFITGAVTLFFRPFFWTAKSAAQLMAAAEIWSLSLLMIIQMVRLRLADWRRLFGMPTFRAAFAAVIGFSFLYSWMANEGLLVRLRLEVFPAILTLVALPWLMAAKGRVQAARRRRASVIVPLKQSPVVRQPLPDGGSEPGVVSGPQPVSP
jgi:hypothetical protein